MTSQEKATPRVSPRGEAADTTAVVDTLQPESTTSVNPAATGPQDQAAAFLHAVYGDGAPGWLTIYTLPNRVTAWVQATDLDHAATLALNASKGGQNVYVGVGLQRERLHSGRGTAATVGALVALWADVDIAGPGHADGNYPPDEAAALAVVAEFPLPPTVIVHSGHGLQPWWLFREAWTLDTDTERAQAAELARRWLATLQRVAARHGWRLDATADLARVLRLPGTTNWKLPEAPAPVRLLQLHNDTRYTRDDFEPFLLFEDAAPAEPNNGKGAQGNPSLLVELPKAAEALKRLKPERCDVYDDWLRVGMALSELGDAGLALWDEWSQGSQAKYQPGVCAAKWTTFKPGDGITLASLYHWATEDQAATEDATPARKPTISVKRGILHELATGGENALIRAGAPIYARGDLLQRPVLDEVDAADGRKTQVVRLATVTPEGLVDHLSRAARWQRFDQRRKGWVPDDPPTLVAKIILSRVGEWRLPKITGVITTPTLRPDGSLLAQPGYDPATQLLLVSPPEMPPLAEHPGRAEAEEALALLDGLLVEFPFIDDVSRAVALSALITPIVRPALGQAPMHTFTSPEQGTGKSFLVDLCSAIANGRWCPVIAAGDCDRAELEKRLGAAAITATPLLSLDNVNSVLASDLLCQLIERPLVEVRLLGQSRNITIATRMTIFATGNNLAVSGDLVRRTIQCRMDARTERPEQRRFAGDPYGTIVADRGRYVAAALTIVRAYIAAGMPNRRQPLPSFGRWSDYVRSALVWLGCADPVASIETTRAEDPQRAELVAVVEAWAAVCPNEPLTAAELVEKAEGNPALADALAAVASRRGEIDTRALGYWLRGQRDRVVGGWRIELVTRGKGHHYAWLLAPVR